MPETYTSAFKTFLSAYTNPETLRGENVTAAKEGDKVKLTYEGGVGASSQFPAMQSQLHASGIDDVQSDRGALVVTVPADQQSISKLHEAASYAGANAARKIFDQANIDAKTLLVRTQRSTTAADITLAKIIEGYGKPKLPGAAQARLEASRLGNAASKVR